MWSIFQAKSKVSAGNFPALQLPVVYIVSPAQSSSTSFMQIWPPDMRERRKSGLPCDVNTRDTELAD